MRFRIANPKQAWVLTIVLSWTTGIFAQEPLPPEPPKDDPLIVKPTTVEGKFDAALFMLKLARPDLARFYLEQALADNPTDEDLLALRTRHGSGTFLELTAIKELEPLASQLLDRLNTAIQTKISDPAYANGLISKLQGSQRERAEALSELRHLGPYAVSPIIRSIATGANVSHEVLTTTLTQLGTNATAPLIGALASPSVEVRTVAAKVLGRTGAQADVVWLWYPAFGADQPTGLQVAARESLAQLIYRDVNAVQRIASDGAARSLISTATQYLNGKFKWPEMQDDESLISVWSWNPELNTVSEYPVARPLAAAFFAERLSREATLLAPDSQQGPVVLLASLLTREVMLKDWQTTIPDSVGGVLDLAVRCGPELCEQVLRFALDQKLNAAALGSLQALALNGSPALLAQAPGQGAVTAALDAPDARVQFAAAVTILHWEPTVKFRGARRVVEILARTLNSDTHSASIVMDPNVARANETAGMFTELGYHAAMVKTGMEGFRIAAERGNIELAVLHPNMIRWDLSQTIANLRADARTASIPVVIYGPASIHDQFEQISHEYKNVIYVDEANVPLDVHRSLSPLLAQLSPPPLTTDQRKQQMQEASFWLRRIAIRNVSDVFDLAPAESALLAAITIPELAEDALISLGAIGSSSVQEGLLATALAPGLPIETRRLAASQLAFHIQHYGGLLTKAKLNELRATLKNETDPGLLVGLASVVGSLKPAAPASRLELLRHPPSPAPVELTPAEEPAVQE